MRELLLILVAFLIAISLFKEYLNISSSPHKNDHITEFDPLDGDDEIFSGELSYLSSATKELQSSGSETQNYKFDGVFWPQIQNALCPDMVPNMSLAKSRIFHLARERLNFLRAYEETLVKRQEEDDVYNRFFDFHASINTYDPDKNDPNSTVLGYVAIWKCANEQIRYAMSKSLGDGFKLFGGSDFCLFFKEDLPQMSNQKPCMVTAVRDPISHFLSAYNEIEWRYQDLNLTSEWADHPQIVFTRYRHGTKKRFEQFVRDFLSGPIVERRRPYLDYPLELPHTFLMSGILTELSRCGENLTAYLPSLDNLTEIWPKFLAHSCPSVEFPENFATTPMDLTGQHLSSTDDMGDYGAAKTVWQEGGPVAEALCILHVMDYACFDKLKIPVFCREVYNDKDFVLALTSDDFDEILPNGVAKEGS